MILYKYLNPNRIDVLENGLIRFTQPKFFNDPFEALPKVEKLFSGNLLESLYNLFSDYDYLNSLPNNFKGRTNLDQIKEIFIREGFAENKELFYKRFNSNDNLTEGMNDLYNFNIGVLSLSEVSNSILMWSHYTANHKGFVIGFNSSKDIISTNNSTSKPNKVIYSKNRPHIPLFEERFPVEQNYICNWYMNFILTKSTEWKYEREWRQTVLLQDYGEKIGEDIYLFKYNIEAVEEIILGSKIMGQDEERILEIVKDWRIKVFKMYLNESHYSLDMKQIN